jgi:hypothetical protein
MSSFTYIEIETNPIASRLYLADGLNRKNKDNSVNLT